MEIDSAYWDDRTKSLVLLTPDGSALTGPTLDIDHLYVALRAALAGEPLGVSIDPPADIRHRPGAIPSPGSPMYVSYLGSTRGTAFGAIMFEADRVLKCLTKGIDNETGRPYRVNVPGFRTLLERMCTAGDRASGSWHRFWFVIDDVSISLDRTSRVLRFDDVRLKVLNECEIGGSPSGDAASACDRAFVEHLTEHFDLYAAQEPSLHRLKELARTTALAQYLVREGAALDLSTLFATPPIAVDTPDETPAVVASKEVGGGSYIQLVGGVDLDVLPTMTELQAPELATLRADSERMRPGRSARTWRIPTKEGGRTALAVPLGKPRAPFRPVAEDHRHADGHFRLRRQYDSSDVSPGDFGPGWRLEIPYRITPVELSRKRPEAELHSEPTESLRPRIIVLHDLDASKAERYRRVKGHQVNEVYARVQHQERTSDGIAYAIADGNTIQIEGSGYRLRRNGTTYRFAGDGRLQRINSATGKLVVFDWDGPHLRSISDCSGGRYAIVRDSSNRISRIDCPDGAALSYEYDQAGWLAATLRDGSRKGAYRYDQHGRLTEIRDRADMVVRRISYDAHGNTGTTSDRCDGPQDAWLERHFKGDRLASVSDHRGWQATYSYGEAGEIRSVAVRDSRRPLFTLHYNDAGMLHKISNQTGHVDVAYEANKIRELTRSDGVRIRFDNDSDKRSIVCEGQRGDRWVVRLDADDMLSEVIGPAEERLSIRRRPGDLLLRSDAGSCRLKRKRDGMVLRTKMRRGPVFSTTFSREEITIRKESPWYRRTRSEMKISPQVTTLSDAAGSIEWSTEPNGATVRVKVTWAQET